MKGKNKLKRVFLVFILVLNALLGFGFLNKAATIKAADTPAGTQGVDWDYIGATSDGVPVASDKMGTDVVWYFSGTKLVFEGIGDESRAIKDTPSKMLDYQSWSGELDKYYNKINIYGSNYDANINEIEFKNIKRIGSNTINAFSKDYKVMFVNGVKLTFDDKIEEIGKDNFININYLDELLEIPASIKKIESKGLGFDVVNANTYQQYLKTIRFLGTPESLTDVIFNNPNNILQSGGGFNPMYTFLLEYPSDWPTALRPTISGNAKTTLWHSIYVSVFEVQMDLPEIVYGDVFSQERFDVAIHYSKHNDQDKFVSEFTFDHQNIIRSSTNKKEEGELYTKGGIQINTITSSLKVSSIKDQWTTYDFYNSPSSWDLGESNTKTQLSFENRTFLFLNIEAGTDSGFYFIPYHLKLQYNEYASYEFDKVLTVEISKKILLVTGVTSTARAYNGVEDTSVTVTGTAQYMPGDIIPSDEGKVSVSFKDVTFSFYDGNAGAQKPLKINGATITGERAYNYTFMGSVTGTITPKPLTFNTKKQYIDYPPKSYEPVFTPNEEDLIPGDVVNATKVLVCKNSYSDNNKTPDRVINQNGGNQAKENGKGEYTAYLASIDNPNYSIPVAYTSGTTWNPNAIKIEFVLQNPAYKITAAPTGTENLVYDGDSKTLISDGGTCQTGGTMQYSLDGETWDTEFPIGTDAGTYIVYYRVKGDASHGDSQPVELEVTIAKADTTDVTAPTALTLYANGEDQTLIDAGSSTQGTLEYSLDGSNWAEELPVGNDKGVYTVYYRVKGDGNHNDLSNDNFKVEVTINAPFAEFEAPTAKEGASYSGTAVEIIEDGSSTQGTMKYYLSTSELEDPSQISTWTNDATTIKANAGGTYYIYYYCEADANHSSTEIGYITVFVPILIQNSPFTISSVTYTGSDLKPSLTQSTTSYTEGTDFDIVFGDSVDHKNVADDIPFKVVFKGAYTGSIDLSFSITPKSLTADNIEAIADQEYTGSAIQPTTVVKDDTYTLVEDTDYTVAYSNNTEQGTATATITFKGNYTGTPTKEFKIVARNVENTSSGVSITDISDQTYSNTSDCEPEVEVKHGDTTLEEDTDYTVAYSNNTSAGTATVTITFKGNYTGTLTKEFTISPKTLGNDALTISGEYTYNGTDITPTYEVKDGTTTLTKDTDYTVTITNNKNANTNTEDENAPTVTITFKGNYTGSASKTFAIAKKEITVTITPNGGTYGTVTSATAVFNNLASGETLTPVITYTGTDYDDTDTPTNAGTYTITITLPEGTTNYELTGTTTDEFVIAKKDITGATVVYDESKVYSGSEQTFAVTSVTINSLTATFDVTNNKATDYDADGYTLTITANGNFTGTITKTFVIAKKDITDAEVVYDESKIYNGEEQTFEVTSVTIDSLTATFDVTNNKATDYDADGYTLTITANGNFTGSIEKKFVITKREITVTITPNGGTYGTVTSATAVFNNLASGETLTPVITYTGTDYDDTDTPTNAGTYTITITLPEGTTNYELTGTTTAEFVIAKKDITGATVVYDESKVYSGSEQTFAVTSVTINSLTATFDVTNNKATDYDADGYTLTITANGNFTGTITKKFTITKSTNTIHNLSIENWIEGESAKLPTATSDFGQIKYSYAKAGSTTFDMNEAPTKAGNYIVKAEITGNDNFDSVIVQKEFTIFENILAVGGSDSEKAAVTIVTEKGFDPNIVLEVELVAESDEEAMEKHEPIVEYKELTKAYEKVASIYDVNLLLNNMNIQPEDLGNGTVLTIRLLVPEHLISHEFRFMHVHSTTDIQTVVLGDEAGVGTYIIDEEGYLVTKIDKLSEFVFIYQPDCSLHWFMVGLLAIEILLFVILHIIFRKEKCALIVSSVELVASIVLGIFGGCYICLIFTIIDIVVAIAAILYIIKQIETYKETSLKENLAKVSDTGNIITKAEIVAHLAKYGEKVELHTRANETEPGRGKKVGLPLADTHYVVFDEEQKECFIYVYENANKGVLILLKTSNDRFLKLKKKHKSVTVSTFPKAHGDNKWYALPIDNTYTKEEIYAILDEIVEGLFDYDYQQELHNLGPNNDNRIPFAFTHNVVFGKEKQQIFAHLYVDANQNVLLLAKTTESVLSNLTSIQRVTKDNIFYPTSTSGQEQYLLENIDVGKVDDINKILVRVVKRARAENISSKRLGKEVDKERISKIYVDNNQNALLVIKTSATDYEAIQKVHKSAAVTAFYPKVYGGNSWYLMTIQNACVVKDIDSMVEAITKIGKEAK